MAGPKLELLLAAQDQTGSAFDSLNRNLQNLESRSSSLQAGVSKLTTIADQARTAFVALGGALLLDRALAFDKQVQTTIGSLKDQADAVGLTTTQLQAYQAAIRAAGGQSDDSQRMLGSFNDALGKAAAGDKAAAQAFIDLKVKILDLNGNVRDNAVLLTETSRALLGVENQATRTTLSTVLFNKEGKTATPILREFAKGMDDLKAAAQAAGLVVDNETIATMDRLNQKADESSKKIENLWATFSAPIKADALSFVSGRMQEIANSLALFETHTTGFERFREVMNLMSLGLGSAGTGETAQSRSLAAIAAAEGRVVEARKGLAALSVGTNTGKMDLLGAEVKVTQADVDNQAKVLQQAEQNLVTAQNIYRKFQATAPVAKGGMPQIGGDDGFGGLNGPLPGSAGAKFALPKDDGRDRIAEEIAKIRGDAAAATAGLSVLQKAQPTTLLADLERAADLEKKIGEIVASSGKYKPSDARIQQLRDEAANATKVQQAYDKFKASLELADATEAKYGNGLRQLIKTEADLDAAKDTGRLSQEAMTNALVEATRAQEDQALKAKQYAQGIDGLAAGWHFAANQYVRSNSAFEQGGKIFQSTTQLMSTALSDFVTKGQVDFNNLLGSFAGMLAQMAAQAAASSLFSSGSGALGGLFDSIFGGAPSVSSLNQSALNNISSGAGLPGVPAFAAGGRPPRGVPYLVGENGPEIRVDDGPGTIFPNGTGPGGGGGGVTVHQTMIFGSDVDKNTLKAWGDQVQKNTLAAVIDARKRGGKMKQAF